MTLNEKFVNYKVLDLVILYNFDIKFDFIQNHMEKNINFFDTICRGGPCHQIFREGWPHHPPLKMVPFLGAGDGVTRPYKCSF